MHCFACKLSKFCRGRHLACAGGPSAAYVICEKAWQLHRWLLLAPLGPRHSGGPMMSV